MTKIAPLIAVLALGGCWWAKDLPRGEGWSSDEGASSSGCVGKSCSDDGSRAGGGGGPTSGAAGAAVAAGAGQCGPGGASGGEWQPAIGGAGGAGGAVGGASGAGWNVGGASGGGWGPGGAGGGGDEPPVCAYPPIDFHLAPWSDAGPSATLDAALARGAAGIVGSWHGVVSTPWTSPYEVSVTFRADGTYSARCAWSSNVCCLAFYYGTDDDTSLKRYRIDTVNSSQEVSGPIDIIYGSKDVDYYPSGYQGNIRNLRLSPDESRMQFEFLYGEYGPTLFDLARVP